MKKIIILTAIYSIFNLGSTKAQDFWEALDTPPGVTFVDIAQILGDTLLATSIDSGMYITYNNGDSWEKHGGIDKTETIYVTNDTKVFVTQGGNIRIYYSLDTCKTWTASSYLPTFREFQPFIYVDYLGRIYSECSNGKIVRSADMGQTWDEVFSLVYGAIDFAGIYVHPITGDMFIGVRSFVQPIEGIWKSFTGDSGSWQVFKPDLDFVTAMAFKKTGEIYAGTSGHYHNSTCLLYESTDYGDNWDIIFGGDPVNDIIILPNDDIYICSMDQGVYFKDSASSTFIDLTSGMGGKQISNLSLINNHLFAVGHLNYTIYRSINPVTNIGIEEKRQIEPVLNVYPNPLYRGNILTIEINEKKSNGAQLTIYSSIGDIIYSNNSNPNRTTYKINTSKFEPGIYFIKYGTKNKGLLTKKIVII